MPFTVVPHVYIIPYQYYVLYPTKIHEQRTNLWFKKKTLNFHKP